MRNRWLLLASCAVLSLAAACGGSNNHDGTDGGGTSDAPGSGAKPQCSDGIDNDGDGKIDYPNDPGCVTPNQNSEVDDCPDGSNCPQCGNGKDDDGNGLIDYPADPGCTSAADPTEFTPNAAACGGTTIVQLTGGSADGTLASSSVFKTASPCGGGGNAPAIAYEITLTQAQVLVATTAAGDPSIDTVIDIRASNCSDGSAELGCNDNTDPDDSTTLTSTVNVALQPGTYYIIVEGSDQSITGTFHLDVTLLAGAGATCTLDTDCGTGLFCNPVGAGSGSGSGSGSGAKVCAKPECSDGIDNNGDGKTDYPFDPSCTSGSDNSEVTVCPGVDCPQCSDGKDNDGDGETDYPDDTSCTSAAGTSESCNSLDPVLTLTGSATAGDTTGKADDFAPSCAEDVGSPDDVYAVTLPKVTDLMIIANGPDDFSFFPVVDVLDATCGIAGELAGQCDDFDEGLDLGPLPAQTLFIVVDGDGGGAAGAYTLSVTGTVAGGQKCEGALFTAGVLTCETGSTCSGTAGSKICKLPACSDGVDNDHDGKTDFPNDPGCTSPSDDSETDTCPSGTSCPVCGDGKDNDSDGKTDFPADFGCASAAGTSEVFCPGEVDPATVITASTTSSTFGAMHHNETLDCGGADGNDRAFALQLPVAVDSITIDTEGSPGDTVLELWSPQCTGDIQCNDDANTGDTASSVTATNLAPGNYAVSVATYAVDDAKTFKLHVNGTVAAGTACTSALFTGATPVLTCDAGLSCTAGTCQ